MLSEALRLIRVCHDMKQNEAAEKLGISRSYLSEIERGHKEPSLEIIRMYAKVFNIPPSSIMFFAENIGSNSIKEKARNHVASKIIKIMLLLEDKVK